MKLLLAAAALAASLIGAAPASALIVFGSSRCADEVQSGVPLAQQPPSGRDCGPAVWTIRDDGSNPRKWTDAVQHGHGPAGPTWWGHTLPALSPDGRYVATSRTHWEEGATLWLLDLRDGSLRRVSPPFEGGVRFDSVPEWSPDGRKLVFASTRESASGGYMEIFTLDLATGGLQQVTDLDAWSQEPSWSPDGKKIVFQLQETAGFLEPSRGLTGAYAVDPDGKNLRRLTAPGLLPAGLRYSPDGASIGMRIAGGLHRLAVDGSELRAVVTPRVVWNGGVGTGWGVQDFTWADGGKSLVFQAWSTEQEPAGTALFKRSLSDPERPPEQLTNYTRDEQPSWAGPAVEVDVPVDDAPPALELVDTLTGEMPDDASSSASTSASARRVFRVRRSRFGLVGVDGTGVRRASAAVSTVPRGGRCRFLTGKGFTSRRRCGRALYLPVKSLEHWQRRVRRLKTGTRYGVRLRARDVLGEVTRSGSPIWVVLKR